MRGAKLFIGDKIACIRSVKQENGGNSFFLSQHEITRIAETKSGIKYYCGKNDFYASEIDANTELQESDNGLVLAYEFFGLTKKTKKKVEQWIDWANRNPEQVEAYKAPVENTSTDNSAEGNYAEQ